ncbi:hypothetical protein HPB51_006006 [Rhipicephalus microplus]|uniref:Uncharacterized protein n=1 Tax=Rhipicephalus microplus TaxID=6941 RepID=A0A9J6EZ16_RHIMP|nr:hypothetical protein HPB51_006006 [Rhipicephalus microplus]
MNMQPPSSRLPSPLRDVIAEEVAQAVPVAAHQQPVAMPVAHAPAMQPVAAPLTYAQVATVFSGEEEHDGAHREPPLSRRAPSARPLPRFLRPFLRRATDPFSKLPPSLPSGTFSRGPLNETTQFPRATLSRLLLLPLAGCRKVGPIRSPATPWPAKCLLLPRGAQPSICGFFSRYDRSCTLARVCRCSACVRTRPRITIGVTYNYSHQCVLWSSCAKTSSSKSWAPVNGKCLLLGFFL